jgi:NitT/TauT family transport system substrate-binding protein
MMKAPMRSAFRIIIAKRLAQRISRILWTIVVFLFPLQITPLRAAEPPLVRIAHGAFSEKIAVLWVGAEQGLFRKHGVNVEVIAIRSGPQTMAALASGDVQIAYTIPGSVVSAAASGLDVAFFAGIINLAEGDFVGGRGIRSAEDLRGKRLGVQSIGGGTWSNSMLALEYLGLEPNRDKITVLVVGDTPILAQALVSGNIEAAYLTYGYSKALKDRGFPLLLDMAKAPIPYQGLAAATRHSTLRQNPPTIDALMRGFVETIAFIQTPANKPAVIKSLVKNLRWKTPQDAESGYESLQWMYTLDVKPNAAGIANMHRLLALSNPKVKSVKLEDVVDEAPFQRLEKSAFYRQLTAQLKK